MYIDNNLPYDDNKFKKLNLCCKDIESQCISLNVLNLREIILINIYRPPQGSLKNCIDLLSKFTDNILGLCKSDAELYFMGDFNVDFLDKEKRYTTELI